VSYSDDAGADRVEGVEVAAGFQCDGIGAGASVDLQLDPGVEVRDMPPLPRPRLQALVEALVVTG